VLHESYGRCRDDNPTRPKLCAVPLVMEAMAVVIRVSGYSAAWFHVKLCAKCTLHSCCRLSSLTAEHTNSSVVGQPFSKLVASSGGVQQQSPGSFLSAGVGVKF
jgi:hypothetical protein